MPTKINEWMIDTEIFETINTFSLHNDQNFDFEQRPDDLYISLISKAFLILSEIDNEPNQVQINNLLQYTKSLLIFTNNETKNNFSEINTKETLLISASIFNFCNYETIASLIIGKNLLSEDDPLIFKLIYGIISGFKKQSGYNYTAPEKSLYNFFLHGDASILTSLEETISLEAQNYFLLNFLFLKLLKKYKNNNLRSDLNNADSTIDWNDYIQHSLKKNIINFLPSQREAINKGLLSFERAFSLQMPTSAGKSYITELAIYQELKRYNYQTKILYLAPLRSLSRELKNHYSTISQALHFKYKTIYGGNLNAFDESLDSTHLLISTPESFISLENHVDELLNNFSLIICDEGQLLDDFQRGINYELLLSRLKKNQKSRFLFLSAIIPNIKNVNTWLGGKETQICDTQYRPCPIKFAIIQDYTNHSLFSFFDENDYQRVKFNLYTKSFLTQIGYTKKALRKKKNLSCALSISFSQKGSTLLYNSNKHGPNGCESYCERIIDILGDDALPYNQQYVEPVIEYISYQFGVDYILCKSLTKGFACHHGSIPQDVRELVENLFEKKHFPLIIATSTLAEGVNMPVKTIIIGNIADPANNNQKLDPTILKNIVGRAGRANYEKYGLVVYPKIENEGSNQDLIAIKNALNGRIRNIKGTLYDVISFVIQQNIDDTKLNQLLEDNSLTESIDRSICYHLLNDSENSNINDITETSLAYHLGNEIERNVLSKIFTTRYEVIQRKLNTENRAFFKKSNLKIESFEKMQLIVDRNISAFKNISQPLDPIWTELLFNTVQEIGIYTIGRDNVDFQILKKIAKSWMSGRSYAEISNSMKLDINDVLNYINLLTSDIAAKSRSILNYVVDKTNDSNELLSCWADLLTIGIDSMSKYHLYKKKLTNRIAIHFVQDWIIRNNQQDEDKAFIANNICSDPIATAAIPKIVSKHINQWGLSE